jgi:hypothetical protein
MDILERIDAAFKEVPIPEPGEILARPRSASEDAGAMAAEFSGKHWTMLPRDKLFYYRDSTGSLSAIGFRAYVAAYLKASLIRDDYTADLRESTLYCLRPIEKDASDEERVNARLSLLNEEQREVIASFVRHFVDESIEAERVLDYWRSSSRLPPLR